MMILNYTSIPMHIDENPGDPHKSPLYPGYTYLWDDMDQRTGFRISKAYFIILSSNWS